jgi:hypothetical protein
MSADPIDIAIREITETRRLIEALILSSESFDYNRAKATLEELRLKAKSLGRIQADLMVQSRPLPEGVIPFPSALR